MSALSPIALRLIRGAIWSIASTVLGKGGLVVLTALAASNLSVLEFSRFGMMLGVVAVAQALATLSMGSAATRTIAAYRLDDPARAWRMGRAAMISTCVTASCGACGLLIWLLASERIEDLGPDATIAVTVIVLGLVLRGVLGGVVAGFEAWRAVATSNVLAGATMVIGGFATPENVGLAWFLGVHAISQIIAVTVIGSVAFKQLRTLSLKVDQRRTDAATWRELWAFSLPTFMLGAVPSIAYVIVQHWLEQADATGMALAIFVIAWQLGNMVLMIPSVMSRSFMPVVAGFNTPESVIVALRLVGRLAAPAVLVAAIAALPLLIAPKVLLSLYAPEYENDIACETLRWMAGWAMVAAATIGVEFVAVGRAEIRFALVTRLAWLGVLLVLLSSGIIQSVRDVAIAYMMVSVLQMVLLVASLLRGSLSQKLEV